jgi:hypothetical protein
MSTTVPVGPSKSVAVTVIGLITLLCGGGYAVLGGSFILGGAGWLVQPDPAMGPVLGTWLTFLAAVLGMVGVLFLLFGVLVLLAALGVLWRKQWGRILTYIVAVLAILLGLLCLIGIQDVVHDAIVLALGVAQVLYGILAVVILSMKRADFSGPRA